MHEEQFYRFSFSKKLELRIKAAISTLLTAPLMQKVVSLVFRSHVPFRGLRIVVSKTPEERRTKCALLFQMYESAELRFIQRYLPNSIDVIELGSSIGVTSCVIRRMVDSDKRLVCVEADKDLSQLIQANLELNNLNFNTTIINAAVVGETTGVKHTLFSRTAENTCGHLLNVGPGNSVSEVPAITLDDIVQRASFDLYALVCDIEGAEWDVLRNSSALKRCSLLIIELHSVKNDPERSEFDSLLRTLEKTFGFEVKDFYGPVVVLAKAS